MKFAAISEHRAQYPVVMMCRLLGVSKSGFYAWLGRPASAPQSENEALKARIVEIHVGSRGTYGSPRIQAELLESGCRHGRNRIARLMRELGVEGVHKRRHRTLTRRDERDPVAPNVLEQDFQAVAPNEKWVADITYVRTHEGWLYLATVMDLFSRRIVGWSMSDRLETTLVRDALVMAMRRRGRVRGVIHHSDRGCQYTSRGFRSLLRAAGIRCSMSGTGNCYDNAVAESFFATLKKECVPRNGYRDRNEARAKLFDYIENFYNRRRRHSALGYVAPARYEAEYEGAVLAA